MPIGKLGRRRHVVIPQDICDKVGLKEGDFVEVQAIRGRVIIQPKKLIDADGIPPCDEEGLHRETTREAGEGGPMSA